MSRWELKIPHRHPDQLLIDVANDCGRCLTGEDAIVARKLVMASAYTGMDRVGQLLDALEGLEPALRLALVDAARVGSGLKSVKDVETEEMIERLSAENRRRPPREWRRSESGAIIEIDPGEAARDEARLESRRRQREAEAADRAVEVEARAAHQRAIDDQAQRELPSHLRSGTTAA